MLDGQDDLSSALGTLTMGRLARLCSCFSVLRTISADPYSSPKCIESLCCLSHGPLLLLYGILHCTDSFPSELMEPEEVLMSVSYLVS